MQAHTGNIGDLSRSLVCSSISSKISTESYLFKKNINMGAHHHQFKLQKK